MAYYAALTSLLQLLHDISPFGGHPYRTYTFLLGLHPVVESLRQKFTYLEGSLQHYSSNGDELNDRWEGRIRDAAYRAQDIIEIKISKHIGLQQRMDMEKCSQMSCFGWIREKRSNCKYIKELQKLEKETDSIMEEMRAIKERQQTSGEDSKLNWDSPTTSASVQTPAAKNIMVGFDEDLNIIKEQLCGQRSRLEVIPIVGMGGIGKTTLARNTFDDALVAYHFDCRLWVTISQDYHENKVLQIISESLKSLMKDLLGGGVGGDLRGFIYKCLKGKRYLIAVDDIWSTQVWDDMKMIFPDDSNGSRIMLTTRLLDIARYASPSGFLHEVQLLNKEKSWNLLHQKVFSQECCPPELEDIGMRIARECHGLPLALVVIAGILSNFRTLHHWENIAGKVSALLSTDEQMSRILSLSYNHLPHILKACFLYLGSFPEDYKINIPNLVRLWIADGLFYSNTSAEMVEEECIKDLVKRNLVLINGKRANGQFRTCMLHDRVREFCRERASIEFFFHVVGVEGHLYPREIEKIRHINYYNVLRRGESRQFSIGKLARCVNFYSGALDEIDFTREFAWDDVKLLRVLNSSGAASRFSIKDIPEEIFGLLHLKYFSYTMDRGHNVHILASMFKLRNLQTIVLFSWDSESIILPPQFWQMAELRHLIIMRGMRLPSIPVVNGRIHSEVLWHLQTLMTVVDCGFSKEVIQMIQYLRKLKVKGRESDIKNLVHLRQLEELKIEYYSITSDLSFPSNLKKLSLSFCHIPWHDMTMVGSLPNLQVLKLGKDSFVGEEWEPKEGEFVRLKFLQFHNLSLKYWKAECTHFPRLEYLRILRCEDLEMIPLEIGDIPTLKVIEVSSVNFRWSAAANSAIEIREDQQNQGNDELQVRISEYYTRPAPTYMELSHG